MSSGSTGILKPPSIGAFSAEFRYDFHFEAFLKLQNENRWWIDT